MAQGGQPENCGGRLQLNWDEIHAIMERAVKRGLDRRKAEPVSQIGIDEKAFRKGHSYLTLVNDLTTSRCSEYFDQTAIGPEQVRNV